MSDNNKQGESRKQKTEFQLGRWKTCDWTSACSARNLLRCATLTLESDAVRSSQGSTAPATVAPRPSSFCSQSNAITCEEFHVG